MSNRSNGLSFEADFCWELSDRNYWVTNLVQSSSGQPADIIAVKNNVSYLIDCKDCRRNKFKLSRIEENQKMAMGLFEACGNKEAWFALRLNTGEIFMFRRYILDVLACNKSELSESDIREHGIPFENWGE